MTDSNLNTPQGNSAPEGAPEAGPPEPQTPQRNKSSMLARNNLVLGGLFVTAVAVIAVLHFKAGPQSAQAASTGNDAQMDTLLSALTQAKNDCRSSTAQSIVKRFYCEAKQRQVPPDQLAGNPFRMVLPKAPPPREETPPPAAPVDPEAQSLSAALDELRDLTLQSVLTGSSGATAVISNNVLTVGQKICGWTVVEITPRQVVLQWKNHRHVLSVK